MEQNFQTSFIPKKPMIEERAQASRPVGIFMVLSLFVLFTVLVATGGIYFYKTSLQKNAIRMEADLNAAQNRFEPSKIIQLQTLDRRLVASTDILSKHIAISPVFDLLESLTMKSVRYTKFSYDFADEKGSKVLFRLSGQAIGYRSVALQSDIFAKNKQIIDPVFSNLNLDNSGNVIFDLVFTVDPTLINYKQVVSPKEANASLPANGDLN
ncbi:MAG: hypothetical protein KBD55_01855 [Candidatus Pacebacteria bacterium]|nr:hypothetical protein [Candidatus Paceibacterota bacterium]